jgi:hypothetical protein
MQVGRKGALMLLAVVVLWAAMPSFACLKAATRPSCCQEEMQDCGSPLTMASPDCCAVQPSPAPILPGDATNTGHRENPAALHIAYEASLQPLLAVTRPSSAADSPPRSSSAATSVLRL